MVGVFFQVEDGGVVFGFIGMDVFEDVYVVMQGVGEDVGGGFVLRYQFVVLLNKFVVI